MKLCYRRRDEGPNLFHAQVGRRYWEHMHIPGTARMAGCCCSVHFYFWASDSTSSGAPSQVDGDCRNQTDSIPHSESNPTTTYTNSNKTLNSTSPRQHRNHLSALRLQPSGWCDLSRDGGRGIQARRADKAAAGGEGAGQQGGGGAAGAGQGEDEDVPVGEQHHHAPPPLQGRPQGHPGRLRPLRRRLQRDDRQRGAAELPEQAGGAHVGEGGRRRAPLLRRRQPQGDPVPRVRRPHLPHVPALRPQRHAPGFRVRVGQAQLHLRRAHRRLPLLQQGRRWQGDPERRHPEDERGVRPGEDAHPHNHTAIQGDGPEQERQGEPQGVPLLHDQMGGARARRRR